jgi:hypothetical protein
MRIPLHPGLKGSRRLPPARIRLFRCDAGVPPAMVESFIPCGRSGVKSPGIRGVSRLCRTTARSCPAGDPENPELRRWRMRFERWAIALVAVILAAAGSACQGRPAGPSETARPTSTPPPPASPTATATQAVLKIETPTATPAPASASVCPEDPRAWQLVPLQGGCGTRRPGSRFSCPSRRSASSPPASTRGWPGTWPTPWSPTPTSPRPRWRTRSSPSPGSGPPEWRCPPSGWRRSGPAHSRSDMTPRGSGLTTFICPTRPSPPGIPTSRSSSTCMRIAPRQPGHGTDKRGGRRTYGFASSSRVEK